MSDTPITRIDIERVGATMLSVRQWYEGWIEGQAPDIDEITSGRIEDLLDQYTKQGFACWMASNAKGRALRGKTTRIDFIRLDDGWHIRKYPYGWTAKTSPLSDETKPDTDIAQAIAWCKANGWTVREWPNGARAWKGEIKPIRDTNTIKYLRRQVNQTVGDIRRQFDLAFDF